MFIITIISQVERYGVEVEVGTMLIGEFYHTIDPKGRVIVPQQLREDLGESFFVTKGLDECLFVYPTDGWVEFTNKIDSLPLSDAKDLQRFFNSRARMVQIDKQGRILIPQILRDFAGLKKDIVIVGASVRAEIWDKDRWDEFNDKMTAADAQALLKKMGF